MGAAVWLFSLLLSFQHLVPSCRAVCSAWSVNCLRSTALFSWAARVWLGRSRPSPCCSPLAVSHTPDKQMSLNTEPTIQNITDQISLTSHITHMTFQRQCQVLMCFSSTFFIKSDLMYHPGEADSETAALGYFITPCVGTIATLFSYLLLLRLVSLTLPLHEKYKVLHSSYAMTYQDLFTSLTE